MQVYIFGFFLLLSACATQPDYRPNPTPPETVKNVDLSRYAGTWFEIARYPNSFEKNCQGVTAEYEQKADGSIRVLNTCRIGSPDGKIRTAEGRARVVEGTGNAKLRVKFAPAWVPFAEGDYWILHLEADYSAALVGDPSGRYLWILARENTLTPETLLAIKTRAAELGYDPNKLEPVAH
ncbi:MAG: lipocalin family protein [Granulosicoccus sp.]|nr:lipocalin family protein [Granulosicoccus sp.]